MAIKYRRSLIIIAICIAIVVNFFCFWLGYQNYLEPKLGDFQIQNLIEKDQQLYLVVEECHNAVSYEVTVMKDQEVILESSSTTNLISLEKLSATYGDILTYQVYAKNKNGTKKAAEEVYSIPWQYASFVNYNTRYLNTTSGLSLSLLGYQKESYQLKLEYLNQVIHEENVQSDNIFIPYEKIEGYAGRITAKLYTKNNTLISTYNFYMNTPIIGKVKITSPTENARTRWNDIHISFQGGENATEYHLLLWEEGVLVDTFIIPNTSHEYNLTADHLKENKNYRLTLEAAYLDYQEITESDQVNIYVSNKETTSPTYVSHNPSFIKPNTKITIASRTPEAQIYYTLDGSDPTTDSILYRGPIIITEDVTIKSLAVSKNRYDSSINTYSFHIADKQLVVYLSPSNQYLNFGVSSAGFTNEMKEMNQLANVIERILKENGVKVYRNRSSGNINEWLNESNYVKSDLHLAIHSNAASTNARGIEIYVDSDTSKSLSIATQIYQNLYAIYPGNHLAYTDRGIKYANGSLGEANDHFIPCGTLIEVAYHDNYEDAKWIVENRESIGNNIAQSILSYYN